MKRQLGISALCVGICRAFLLPLSQHNSLSHPHSRTIVAYEYTTSSSQRTQTTALAANLWERLEIEEDPEPYWYLINCVAGLELDLLEQCREVCGDDHPDVVRFIVPTERKTRSHGANKMVTETKVMYLGYVFGKIRLCKDVYERIQGLDLCRSWMGTINQKGYRKLPPAPLALGPAEVKSFGLEEWEDDTAKEVEPDYSGVIVDIDDDEDMKAKVDGEAVEKFLGLKVEDMVKVTAKNKFFDEEGIVRRLKDGKIMVRFYTYGTMFEEWLAPEDVRKLSELEVLRGLAGPSQPITQEDFDGPKRGDGYNVRPGDYRRGLGGGPQRNRRQDRAASQYSDRRNSRGESFDRERNDRNWKWYQDQQHDQRRKGAAFGNNQNFEAGSRKDDDWALGDVESQWGRGNGPPKPWQQQRRQDNRKTEAALDGDDDWSAFVSSPSSATPSSSKKDEQAGKPDDFFDSLMSDLSKELDSTKRTSNRQENSAANDVDDGDFFDSLMDELAAEERKQTMTTPTPKSSQSAGTDMDDDFFSNLEAELGSVLGDSEEEPSTSNGQYPAASSLFGEQDDASATVKSDPDLFLEEMFDEISSNGGIEEKQQPPPTSPPNRSTSTTSSMDSGSLKKHTVPVLKDMLRERGLKVSGKKADLIERLLQQS